MKATRMGSVGVVVLLVVLAMAGPARGSQSGSMVGWGEIVVAGDLGGGFTDAAAGLYHSLGLKADGTIVPWGRNRSGECNVPSPNTGFVRVAAGNAYSLGLKADGTIVAWGRNVDGECNVPAPNTGFAGIAAGYNHSLALKADGSIVAWGYNGDGECNVPSPNTGFVAVAAGNHSSLALKSDGSIVAWWWNIPGSGVYKTPSPNAGFVGVAVGGDALQGFALGLKSDGSIVPWGDNWYGQCDVPSPNTGFVDITTGDFHSLGLKSDGTIVPWGNNSYGQCIVPTPNMGFVGIAARWNRSLALRSDLLHTLTLSTIDPQWGTVGVEPNLALYEPNQVVTLTATPVRGKSFNQWTIYDPNYPGDANHATYDSNTTITIVMNADRQVDAAFKCGGLGPAMPLAAISLGILALMRRRRSARGIRWREILPV